MARAYSQDLRDRVIDAALGGMPARRAAAQFEIGVATAIVWVRRVRASGERMARRQGQPRKGNDKSATRARTRRPGPAE